MTEFLRQTVLQEELAQQINEKLEPGLQVSFHRVREEDSEEPDNVVTFYFHGRSKYHKQRDDFFDVAGIVREVKAWRASLDLVAERYTTEMPEGFLDGPLGTSFG